MAQTNEEKQQAVDEAMARAFGKAKGKPAQFKARPVLAPVAPIEGKTILGSMVKFNEAIKLSEELSPLTSASSRLGHVIKMLPTGWITVSKNADTLASYVPPANVLYFIPKKEG